MPWKADIWYEGLIVSHLLLSIVDLDMIKSWIWPLLWAADPELGKSCFRPMQEVEDRHMHQLRLVHDTDKHKPSIQVYVCYRNVITQDLHFFSLKEFTQTYSQSHVLLSSSYVTLLAIDYHLLVLSTFILVKPNLHTLPIIQTSSFLSR